MFQDDLLWNKLGLTCENIKTKKTIWWNFWFVILIQKRKEGFEFPHMDYNTNS